MPKVGGGNIDECMEMCMSDEKTQKEYPDAAKRKDVCYAACKQEFLQLENKEYLHELNRLIDKLK